MEDIKVNDNIKIDIIFMVSEIVNGFKMVQDKGH